MVSDRTPEQVALAVSRETGWNIERDADERGWASIGMGPVGRHRDSDALARSNFGVIYADLSDRFGESVDIAHFGHWAVGWVEEIIFDAGRPDIIAAVAAWRERLDNYPVADEDHWSELEWSELSEYLESEVAIVYRGLDVIPLTESGYDDLYRHACEEISGNTNSVDDVGDISEAVFDAYCAVLLSEHDVPPEQLTI